MPKPSSPKIQFQVSGWGAGPPVVLTAGLREGGIEFKLQNAKCKMWGLDDHNGEGETAVSKQFGDA